MLLCWIFDCLTWTECRSHRRSGKKHRPQAAAIHRHLLRDENVVATTYIARVDKVFIQQGSTVSEGSSLLKLQSLEILERLAELSIKRADLWRKSRN